MEITIGLARIYIYTIYDKHRITDSRASISRKVEFTFDLQGMIRRGVVTLWKGGGGGGDGNYRRKGLEPVYRLNKSRVELLTR